jgi:hypothetical protein
MQTRRHKHNAMDHVCSFLELDDWWFRRIE